MPDAPFTWTKAGVELEKLTESAIIKVALREDLSEVATGFGALRLHPAVGEGVAAGAEPEVRIHLPPAASRLRS